MIRVAVIGARGYVGAELLGLLDSHPQVEILAASSRAHAGKSVATVIDGFSNTTLNFTALEPKAVADLKLDVCFLALPNGLATNFVAAIDAASATTTIIDLSADYRFDDSWVYGQPERQRGLVTGAKRIANPGCYATGAQLGLAPIVAQLAEPPAIFGISGYSGAGTTPSRNNDSKILKNNIIPYKLTDHIHEREVSRTLAQQVRFSPHVASFFRGIQLTISGKLKQPMTATELENQFQNYYQNSPLVNISTAAPEVRDAAGKHSLQIGGFTVSEQEPGHFVLVVTLDNLLKGAATQALQNMNLALSLEYKLNEFDGINYD
ncbi:MAG: N-acetyl-gamma-glutamyl-phosphate reductase [Xanthomonadales bacterium]|nr:N-acetyl-gamma-glutamyl-phosphate reductase [Xanthomonadales bacterium]